MAFSGTQLKSCRLVVGLTQRDLGRKIGCDHASISRYEREAKVPKLVRIQKLAAVLGVSVDDLLDGRGVHVR